MKNILKLLKKTKKKDMRIKNKITHIIQTKEKEIIIMKYAIIQMKKY